MSLKLLLSLPPIPNSWLLLLGYRGHTGRMAFKASPTLVQHPAPSCSHHFLAPLQLPKARKPLLSRGRFTAELNWESSAPRRSENSSASSWNVSVTYLLAVFLMQGQCLLYQTENLVTDRTLPILYSSPIDTGTQNRP